MINTLETGAANLTLADTNEEAANLLALQTRQQLSSTALSMASQSDQAVPACSKNSAHQRGTERQGFGPPVSLPAASVGPAGNPSFSISLRIVPALMPGQENGPAVQNQKVCRVGEINLPRRRSPSNLLSL